MKHWTEVEDVPSANTPSSKPPTEVERRYALRPLWQRLLFSAGLIAGGVAAGGLVLAARDRTVWRMRISRPSLKLPHQQPNRTHLPPKPNAPVTELAHAPASYGPAVLTLETASGRSKKYFLHDCELGPGRDATEMLLRVQKLRGAFVVGLPRSVILGEPEKDIIVPSSPGASVVKGPLPLAKVDLKEYVVKGSLEVDVFEHLVELQRRMFNAWIASGGNIRANAPKIDSADSGWTSGPLASNRQ